MPTRMCALAVRFVCTTAHSRAGNAPSSCAATRALPKSSSQCPRRQLSLASGNPSGCASTRTADVSISRTRAVCTPPDLGPIVLLGGDACEAQDGRGQPQTPRRRAIALHPLWGHGAPLREHLRFHFSILDYIFGVRMKHGSTETRPDVLWLEPERHLDKSVTGSSDSCAHGWQNADGLHGRAWGRLHWRGACALIPCRSPRRFHPVLRRTSSEKILSLNGEQVHSHGVRGGVRRRGGEGVDCDTTGSRSGFRALSFPDSVGRTPARNDCRKQPWVRGSCMRAKRAAPVVLSCGAPDRSWCSACPTPAACSTASPRSSRAAPATRSARSQTRSGRTSSARGWAV